MDEPSGHDVSIRENPPDARALQVVDAVGRPMRAVDLSGGWFPVFYRCRSFDDPTQTRCIVFGRAMPLDDGVQVEIESFEQGQYRSTVRPEFIDELAIATQTLRR
jgi:hypothetical protein